MNIVLLRAVVDRLSSCADARACVCACLCCERRISLDKVRYNVIVVYLLCFEVFVVSYKSRKALLYILSLSILSLSIYKIAQNKKFKLHETVRLLT